MYEQNWIDGLNRGDVSLADETFAPNCIIHMAGAPEPNLSVTAFKELVTGLLTAFPNFQVTVEDQMVSGAIAHKSMFADERMAGIGELPFDGKRMILGGFEPILSFRKE